MLDRQVVGGTSASERTGHLPVIQLDVQALEDKPALFAHDVDLLNPDARRNAHAGPVLWEGLELLPAVPATKRAFTVKIDLRADVQVAIAPLFDWAVVGEFIGLFTEELLEARK